MWNPQAARRIALQMIAVGSLLAGGATLWTILDPVSVRATETWVLLAVLSLFVLPVGGVALFEADFRSRRREERGAEADRADHARGPLDSISAHDIEARFGQQTSDPEAAQTDLETTTRRHSGRKMVSARRPARSAPGRSRASTRR